MNCDIRWAASTNNKLSRTKVIDDHGGAIIFADLIGKLDVLYVHCPKCSRAGRYGVQHLVEARGRNAKLIDWLGLAEGAVVRAIKGVAENQKPESAGSDTRN